MMPSFSRPASTAGGRVRGGLAIVMFGLLAAGCASGPAPVFEGRQGLGGSLLLLEPVVRLGGSRARLLADDATRELARQMRQRLAGRGLEVDPLGSGDEQDALRDRLARIVIGEKLRGRRLRPGASLHVEGLADLAIRRGDAAVAIAVLTRSGVGPDDGEFLPLPEGEIIPLPEDRPDYEVPDASPRHRVGVDLDLLVVDAGAGSVRLHRRVSYPLADQAHLLDAIPVLVREATRGLAR